MDSTKETRTSKDRIRKIEPIQPWHQPIQWHQNSLTASFSKL